MKQQRDTPEHIAELLAKIVTYHKSEMTMSEPETILEPSAGIGLLVDTLFENHFNFTSQLNKKNITCVELNKEKSDICKDKGYDTIHGDFLKHDFKDRKFDMIIAAPPFINNIDVVHIQKMYNLLNVNGSLTTLTSPYWLTNNEQHQVEFRNFLNGKWHQIIMLPENTFIEKGKSVPTAIISFVKDFKLF